MSINYSVKVQKYINDISLKIHNLYLNDKQNFPTIIIKQTHLYRTKEIFYIVKFDKWLTYVFLEMDYIFWKSV